MKVDFKNIRDWDSPDRAVSSGFLSNVVVLSDFEALNCFPEERIPGQQGSCRGKFASIPLLFRKE